MRKVNCFNIFCKSFNRKTYKQLLKINKDAFLVLTYKNYALQKEAFCPVLIKVHFLLFFT